MRPILPLVKESPKYIVLSSSDEEDVDLRSSSSMKSEDVSIDFSDDDSVDTEIDPNPSSGLGQCYNITEPESSHPSSFLVSDTPSRSLGGDTSNGSKPTSMSDAPPSDFTRSLDFSGSQKGDADVSESYDSSVYEYVITFGNQPHSRSLLKSSDLGSFPHHRIKFLPSQYNGDAIYKLPPIIALKEGAAGRLVGKDRSCDGHAWTEMQTTNLSDP
jgi:hypothetical protein